VHRYFCSNHQADARRCPQSRYAAGQKLERHLVQGLAQQFTPECLAEMIAGLNAALASHGQAVAAEQEAICQEIAQVETAAQKLLDALETHGPSTLLFARLQEREQGLARLRTRRAALPAPIALDAVAVKDAAGLAAFVQDDLPRLSRQELQQFFQALNLRVDLYNDRAVASMPWPPLRLLVPPTATGSFVPLDGLEPPTQGLGNPRSVL
jgi:hypothetical protein